MNPKPDRIPNAAKVPHALKKKCYGVSACSQIRTEAVLTTYGSPHFAHVFASRQHALASTAGWDHGFNY